jgi:DNA repair exonuclease SbcCD nuclease subunit
MKLLVVGDLHLHHNHLQRSIDLLKWVEITAEKQDVDAIINLGDTFCTHSVLRSELVAEFGKHISRMNLDRRPYVVLVGNHDLVKPNDSTYHSLMAFKYSRDGLIIVDSPMNWGGMTFVPFLTSSQEWPKNTKPLLFCHETFIGCKYGGSLLAENGRDVSILENDLIISGHIHLRQTLSDKVIYPGTPLATSASDVDQNKGLMVLDSETYQYFYVESPFPMWHNIYIDLNLSDELYTDSLNETDHYVITLTGTRAMIKAALEAKTLIEARKRLSIQIKIETTDTKKDQTISINANNTLDMVSQFLDSVYKGPIDREELKKMAISYMRE